MRNHAAGSIEGRRFALKTFIDWCHERELIKASAITRPNLKSYQAWLWSYRTKADKPLGISTQREKLGALKSLFACLVRQSVITANPASELELPRTEKRLPEETLTPTQIEHIMAVHNITDPLGLRDRTMLEVFYATGHAKLETTAIYTEVTITQLQLQLVHERCHPGSQLTAEPPAASGLIHGGHEW